MTFKNDNEFGSGESALLGPITMRHTAHRNNTTAVPNPAPADTPSEPRSWLHLYDESRKEAASGGCETFTHRYVVLLCLCLVIRVIIFGAGHWLWNLEKETNPPVWLHKQGLRKWASFCGLVSTSRSASFLAFEELRFIKNLAEVQEELEGAMPGRSNGLEFKRPSAYMSGISSAPPIVLHIFSSLDSPWKFFLMSLVWEGLAACCLGRLARHLRFKAREGRVDLALHMSVKEPTKDACSPKRFVEKGQTESRKKYQIILNRDGDFISEETLTVLYLLNPITVASSFFLSFHALRWFLLLAAVSFSVSPCQRLKPWISFAVGPLFLGSLFYVWPLPNAIVILVCLGHAFRYSRNWDRLRRKRVLTGDAFETVIFFARTSHLMSLAVSPKQKVAHFFRPAEHREWIVEGLIQGVIPFGLMTAFVLAVLHGVSLRLMHGSPEYLRSCVVSMILLKDTTPNLGIFWHIQQGVFMRFRLMFSYAYHSLGLMVSLPVFLKFHRTPWIAVQLLTGIVLLLQPQPVAGDFVVAASLLLMDMTLVRQTPLFAELMLGACASLMSFPVMTYIWLQRRMGNPNYAYASQLVFNAFSRKQQRLTRCSPLKAAKKFVMFQFFLVGCLVLRVVSLFLEYGKAAVCCRLGQLPFGSVTSSSPESYTQDPVEKDKDV